MPRVPVGMGVLCRFQRGVCSLIEFSSRRSECSPVFPDVVNWHTALPTETAEEKGFLGGLHAETPLHAIPQCSVLLGACLRTETGAGLRTGQRQVRTALQTTFPRTAPASDWYLPVWTSPVHACSLPWHRRADHAAALSIFTYLLSIGAYTQSP